MRFRLVPTLVGVLVILDVRRGCLRWHTACDDGVRAHAALGDVPVGNSGPASISGKCVLLPAYHQSRKSTIVG